MKTISNKLRKLWGQARITRLFRQRDTKLAAFFRFAGIVVMVAVLIGGLVLWMQPHTLALTGTVYPDGDVTEGWPAVTGCTATTHYLCINEITNLTTNYVNTGTAGSGGEIEEYTMGTVAGTNDNVSQVAVTMYANSVVCNGNTPNCDSLSVNIRMGGTLQTAQTFTMTTTNTAYTATFTGPWRGDGSLQVQIVRNRVGGGSPSNADDDVRLTSMNAAVTYTPNTAPAAPTLSTPSNGSIGLSTTPVFQMRTTDADNDNLQYKIDICSTSNCSSIVRTVDQTASQTGWSGQDAATGTAYVGNSVITSSTMATYTYQAPALSLGTQYWWRAYAIDINGTNTFGSVSGINSFTTNSIPAAPTLSAPANSATGVKLNPVFQFRTTDNDSDYLRYKIDICSTSNCSSIVRTVDQTTSQTGWSGQDAQTGTAYVGNSVITSSTMANHTYQAPALSPGTQYWWRAYAIDPGGSNTWSAVSGINTFTTSVVPAAPTLTTPANTLTNVSVTPLFQFRTTDADNDYLRYKIDICTTNTCSSILQTIDQTASQTGWTGQDTQTSTAYVGNAVITSSTMANYTVQTALNNSTQYWWRAYAIDPGGSNTWSSASSIFSFTTAPPTVQKVQGGTTIRGGTKIGM